jgi:uncharacterized protein YdhG (YjbR/CyaY superfamily)
MEKYKSFADYTSAQNEEVRKLLNELREIIIGTYPNAIESFTYGVPSFDLGKNQKLNQKIMIGGFKKHIGLYPHPDVIEHFKHQLEPYKTSKGTIQFQIGKSLPKELIQDILLYCIEKQTL